MTTAEERTFRGCPVEAYESAGPRTPPSTHWQTMDGFQDRARPFFRSEEADGYWVFTDYEVILEGL